MTIINILKAEESCPVFKDNESERVSSIIYLTQYKKGWLEEHGNLKQIEEAKLHELEGRLIAYMDLKVINSKKDHTDITHSVLTARAQHYADFLGVPLKNFKALPVLIVFILGRVT